MTEQKNYAIIETGSKQYRVEEGIEIDIEAVKIIAERITDCRGLEGALLSIYAKTFGSKEKVSLFQSAEIPIKVH